MGPLLRLGNLFGGFGPGFRRAYREVHGITNAGLEVPAEPPQPRSNEKKATGALGQAPGLLSLWLQEKRLLAAYRYLRGRVLDYGCGGGVLAQRCRSDQYVGVDIDQEVLEVARRNHPDFRFVTDLPQDEKFDTVVLLAVIEHVSDPAALLKRLKSVLRPGGHVILTTPHPSFRWVHVLGTWLGLFSAQARKEHKRFLSRDLMSDLAQEAGFVVENYKCFLLGANQLFILGQSTAMFASS